MNYEQYIMNELLDKYERSLNYREEGKIKRGIFLEYNARTFSEYFNDSTSKFKTIINSASEALERKGFLKIFWEKHEKGNLIKKVCLITEASSEIYAYINRVSRKEKEQIVLSLINMYSIGLDGWAGDFYLYIKTSLENAQGIGSYIDINNYEETEMIFKALNHLFYLKEELPARVFSIRLYSNSKKFEKIKGRVSRILRDFRKLDEIEEGEDVLSVCGIVNNPKYVYFSGNLKVFVKNERIDFSFLKPDIGISNETIDLMEFIDMDADYIITIENLTSYHEFIRKAEGKFLAVYLGGYPGMAEIKFLRKLSGVIKSKNIKFFHWGDIDYGGFSIFKYLSDNVDFPIKPLLMDVDILKEYSGFGFQIDYEYKVKLKKLLEESVNIDFEEAIRYMVENNLRLEQECIDITFVQKKIMQYLERFK